MTYSDEETYFSYEIDVYNGPQLPHGIHNFPFSLTLPYNIPSSFESHVGNVRYEVKGQIVRDWKWDHRVRKMITGMYQNTWMQGPLKKWTEYFTQSRFLKLQFRGILLLSCCKLIN